MKIKEDKTKKSDMSSETITRHLRQVEQLRELSLILIKAKKESDEKKKKEAELTAEKKK